MFSERYPIAWQFHKNTCRWLQIAPPMPQTKASVVPPYKEYVDSKTIQLPAVELPQLPLCDVLNNRYSCRNYAPIAVPIPHIASVLTAGYGIKGMKTFEGTEFFERMIPSGGGLYPLEIYLIVKNIESVPAGIYHFCVHPPQLEQIAQIDLPKFYLSQLFINQPYVAESSVIIVATMVLERNMQKYGDRGYRYTLLEAGHLFQNMNLTATAVGLGTLNIGGFLDDELAKLFQIDTEIEVPLYAMALGVPREV